MAKNAGGSSHKQTQTGVQGSAQAVAGQGGQINQTIIYRESSGKTKKKGKASINYGITHS